MFKRSRIKIVAAIMTVLILLWAGTLCVIYASSYHEVAKRNRDMLNEHIAQFTLETPDREPGFGDPAFGKPIPDKRFENMPAFKLSTFYSVALSYAGEVLEIHNRDHAVYTDAQLQEMALQIRESGRTNGKKNNLIYAVADKNGYMVVGFMDNTITQEGMTTLFDYTLIFGAVAIVIFYFLAVYLAKKIVDPLEESYQKQKQFISDAGHELKTPISVVSTNAEVLSREIGDNQWLCNIQYENERMGVLVTQLLDLARAEEPTQQTQRLDLSCLVAGEALPFESVAFEKGLTLSCSIAQNIFVNGSSRLNQLVSILLDNAISHSSGGREVKLSLKEERGFAKLSVINDGDAIPPEQRKLLFERFYRTDEARSSKDNHYGLGLAIAKAIVSSHKGKIQVRCYEGKVEFSVLLPVQK